MYVIDAFGCNSRVAKYLYHRKMDKGGIEYNI